MNLARQTRFKLAALLIGLTPFAASAAVGAGDTIQLNGTWDAGLERDYRLKVPVPGLAQVATTITPGTLWYRRTVELPAGNWTRATLRLGGARFAPAVYVDGVLVSSAEGGMAPTEHELHGPNVVPGKTIQLEIALKSLSDLDPRDASVVPVADRWRSDVSSGLWDAVSLHFSGAARLTRVVPWTDFASDRVGVHWTVEGADAAWTVQAQIMDQNGQVVAISGETPANAGQGVAAIELHGHCLPWSPDTPRTYRLRTILRDGVKTVDQQEITWGLKDFRTEGLGFALNGAPVQLRGGTVVWHRWLRDPEARTIAWDTDWFARNVVRRLKALGANFQRFHLGLPPETLLDLCDREGLMVQVEWPFFHGVKAAPASMSTQWRAWLDVATHHPCVVLVHPWNETEGDELKAAWGALDAILPEYPPLVIAHRDEIPVHKYWWSLFENLGLYYDSAEQFGRPIVVDEFGGNYIDSRGEAGPYPAARESFLRFLGRGPTPERRLRFQAEASAKVAEYWRRLGAAGIAPFCTISSPEDGNDWFLGPLATPQPKPVWAALAATYAPVSVSLEIWDRNFLPGQRITVPVYVFNDTGEARDVPVSVRIVSAKDRAHIATNLTFHRQVAAHAKVIESVTLELPIESAEWRLEAEMTDRLPGVQAPVVSSWDIRTLQPVAPEILRGMAVGVPAEETELRAFLRQNGLEPLAPADPRARLVVLSAGSWQGLLQSSDLRQTLQTAVERGQSVVLLDIGPRDLGAGYKPFNPAQLEGAPRITTPKIETHALFSGITITFREAAEPESHLHPASENNSLWTGLPPESTWLWNGLRGGLVVPAADMEVTGLRAAAFAALWAARGADRTQLEGTGDYYAFRLADYFAFSTRPDDKETISRLRAEVMQRAEDAPALQDRINPKAPVEVINLGEGYRASRNAGQAETLVPLASAGKNLSRTPIVELGFGAGRAKVILSQALTAGRLQRDHLGSGLYDLRYDPAAEQFALNLLACALPEGPIP